MTNPQRFYRRIQTEYYLEIFLITAVSAILLIRFFLKLTGYPILGTEKLHIAHMFWGGLLMAAAVIMAFSFIGRKNLVWVAAIGGVGFGTFIDEIGKFITHDNDYFFQPAVALMYLCFVLIFLGVKSLVHRGQISQTEYLLNALESVEDAVIDDLDETEKQTILNYLKRAALAHPLSVSLFRIIENIVPVPVPAGRPVIRFKRQFQRLYEQIVNLPGFSSWLIALFAFQLMMVCLVAVVMIFFYGFGMEQILDYRIFARLADRVQHLTKVDALYLISSGLSALFIMLGMVRLRRARLSAYRMFERSVLITIFVSQLLAFYKEQFSALAGLFFNILLWVGLQFLINQELLYRARKKN